MATPSVLTFDAEGRAVDFEVWWATRDAAARLAVRRHLPTTERAHFSQYKSAQTLYDAVVARYSSPATAALSRLILPYLFPDLAALPTVTDLITHLRTSDTRYRAALHAEDHFLSVCPTTLTVDLLEQRLLAAETSRVAVGASRGDPRTHIFEGFCPSPLLPSVSSAAAADLGGFESVGAASAPSGRRRTGRGKGGKGTGGTGGGGGGSGGGCGGGWGGGGRGGGGGGVGSSSGGGGGGGGGGGSGGSGGGGGGGGGGGSGGAGRGSTQRSGSGGGQRQQQQCSRETPSPQQLREWYAGRQRGGGTGPCTYVLRTGDRAGEQCGGLHSTQCCFGRLTDAWRHQFLDATEIPRWGDLSRAGVAIFDLDYDAILAAMYAVSTSDEGDCYLCLPPDPGAEAAALGACEAASLGTSASAASGAGEVALSVAVSLTDPSGGPVLASFSTVLPCPAAPFATLSGLYLPSFSTNLVSGADLQYAWVDQFTPGGQRVTHCTCSRTGRHLATFTRRPGSSLYTLTTAPRPVPASGQVAASSQVFAAASRSSLASAPCSCRPLAHENLLWHHRLGHPSLPRLRGMASRALVSGLPRSFPPLPPGPAPTCVPCVEGRQRAAPHSSSFPPTEAPLQTLHMDVCLTPRRATAGSCVPCVHPRPGPPSPPFLDPSGLCSRALRYGASAPSLPTGSATTVSSKSTRSPAVLAPDPGCRLFTWTCGAQPAFVDRVTSVTSCWSLTTTRVTPQSSPCAARVSGADLQDHGVDQFTPASQRVTHYTCARTGRHLARFTRQPGSSLYTLSTESPPVPTSGQVVASSQVFAAASGSGPESAPCSCRLLSHQTLLWHHHLGHPSLPCL
ncbi:unnamed protein product [Closterium sp. NIES-54]